MFHQLFQCPRTIERHQAGAFLDERLRYLAHCTAQGRTRSSCRLKVDLAGLRQVADFDPGALL